jgi:hypothetical protein
MKKYVMKTVLFGLATALVFGSFANAATDNRSPDIKSVEPWPSDLSHGEEVYVDAEIADQSSVEDAWLVISSDGERLRSGTLVDSNNDGYYVSPVAFTAEGGNTYQVTVKATDAEGDQISESVEIEAECSLKIVQKCLR